MRRRGWETIAVMSENGFSMFVCRTGLGAPVGDDSDEAFYERASVPEDVCADRQAV